MHETARWRRGVGVCLLAFALPAHAGLSVDIERVAVAGVVAEGVTLQLPGTEGGPGRISFARVSLDTRQWRSITWTCGSLRLAEGRIRCEHGRLDGPGPLSARRADFDLDTARGQGSLTLGYSDGGRIDAQLDGAGHLRARLSRLGLARLFSLAGIPASDWQGSGTVDGDILADRTGIQTTLNLHAGGFTDASGLHAAEAVEAELQASLMSGVAGAKRWQLSLLWQSGDAFWSPVMVSPGWSLKAQGALRNDRLAVDEARLTGPGVGQARLQGAIDLATMAVIDADARIDDADLSQLVPQFVLPLTVPEQQSRWRVAGNASAELRWRDGSPESGRIDLHEVGFSYLGQRFRVGPLSGEIPWHRDQTSTAHLKVDGLHWQKLDFAPFELEARLHRTGFELKPARLPVLDGAIVIGQLAFDHSDGAWQGRGDLYSDPISLKLLTDALDLPEMAGTLSAAIPGIRMTPERIGFDGAVVVSVFDGFVQATGLEVIDPFGLLPRLNADIQADHIDLEQLTRTFSFGAVSGFVDARVDDLVMAAWRPLRFDARVESSSGGYRRRISQRAVEHITALGGAGAMAAIQRSMLGLFNDFGYRKIGFACRLRGNVCEMSGLDGPGDDNAPFMLVQGGGIPALNVIGYNRRVDWAELIDRLRSATAADAAPVVK